MPWFAEFFKPMIVARMESPAARREDMRRHMHEQEERANF